jgi:hypothetical protein
MRDPQKIQEYLNNVRRHLAPKLRPGIGVSSYFYPATMGGGLLELRIGPAQANTDNVLDPLETVNDVLLKVPQRGFAGNLQGVRFVGTNVVREDDRILLIKGDDDPMHWSDKAAAEDLMMALGRSSK